MSTVRDIIQNAYLMSAIVGDNDPVSDSEIRTGFRELNNIIEELSQDNLWRPSRVIVDFQPEESKSEYTIGVDHSIDVSLVIGDGAAATITCTEPHNYTVGDVVVIEEISTLTDPTYTVTGVPSTTTFIIAYTGSAFVVGSTTAFVQLESEEVPDIESTRPLEIKSLKYANGGSYWPINQLSDDAWDIRSVSTTSSGSPRYFRYINDIPLGVIDFGYNISTAYGLRLEYDYTVPEYTSVNDTVDLHPGYKGFLEARLAANLLAFKAMENPKIEKIAADRFHRIKKLRASKPTEVKSDFNTRGGWYDYKTDTVR